MAIQTKKISDLGSIQNINDNTVFLGTEGGVTGKISFKTIKDALSEGNGTDATIANIISELEGVKESVSVISNTPAPAASSCDCVEKIAALEAKVAALEGFVKALQEEGYLTLAKIKQAAADACPIETSAE